MKPLIQADNLSTHYPVRSGVLNRITSTVRAVDGVSFSIQRGATLGLVGESGSGKTTLGRTLAGLEAPVAGRLTYDGQNMCAWDRAEWRRQRRRIQFIFQDPFASLNPRHSVMDIVTEGLHLKSRREREARAVALLEEVGLDADYRYRYPFEFSGGQRQRVSIARALALRPEFVICDEAVSALDVSVQAQILNLLADLKAEHNLTYLFITHDLNVVRHFADEIAVMQNGQLVEQGAAADLLADPKHPYTQNLLAAVPVPGRSRRRGGRHAG